MNYEITIDKIESTIRICTRIRDSLKADMKKTGNAASPTYYKTALGFVEAELKDLEGIKETAEWERGREKQSREKGKGNPGKN